MIILVIKGHSEEHASSRRRTRKTQNLGPQQRTQKAKENYKIKWAWKIKVNSIHYHHINRNQRYCYFCTEKISINITEDEEHVMFD